MYSAFGTVISADITFTKLVTLALVRGNPMMMGTIRHRIFLNLVTLALVRGNPMMMKLLLVVISVSTVTDEQVNEHVCEKTKTPEKKIMKTISDSYKYLLIYNC
jgi:hypothetical protein